MLEYLWSLATLASLLTAAGILGLLVTRRLAPSWRGPSFVLAVIVTAVAGLVVATVLVGLPGLLSAWTVTLLLVVLAATVALLVPAPSPGGVQTAGMGDAAPIPAVLLASVSVALAIGGALTGVWERVGTGMTGFDSTWYHGPIAAEMIRTGETLSLHFTAPQFLTWFYPHGSELLHAVIGSAWGGDLPSLFVNVAFLLGSLLAAWVLARPWGGLSVPVAVAGVALVLGTTAAFADQFGEARNDLAGAFFLLSGVALLASRGRSVDEGPGTAVLIGLAAGLAAGTKLNFVPPALVLALGPALIASAGFRLKAFGAALGGAILAGGFWYLRNLIESGNPLPWTAGDRLFGLELPGPIQETGGREAGSVLDYALDGPVISDWFIPGLGDGLGPVWPVVLLLGLAGVLLAIFRPAGPGLRIGGLVGLALLISWFVGPTSASGPEGEPLGFVSGLRYLVPGLAVGLALLGPASAGRGRWFGWTILVLTALMSITLTLDGRAWDWFEILVFILVAALVVLAIWIGRGLSGGSIRLSRPAVVVGAIVGVVALVVVGFQVATKYDRDRYRSPSFTVAGLDRAFEWASQGGEGAIGTTATRSYPLRGPDLTRTVSYPGVRTPDGGLTAATDCRTFRRLVNEGGYRYLVLSLDREGVAREYPREVRWVEGDPAARLLFRQPPAAVFEVNGRLDPGGCR